LSEPFAALVFFPVSASSAVGGGGGGVVTRVTFAAAISALRSTFGGGPFTAQPVQAFRSGSDPASPTAGEADREIWLRSAELLDPLSEEATDEAFVAAAFPDPAILMCSLAMEFPSEELLELFSLPPLGWAPRVTVAVGEDSASSFPDTSVCHPSLAGSGVFPLTTDAHPANEPAAALPP
jgi:hypothetical protein